MTFGDQDTLGRPTIKIDSIIVDRDKRQRRVLVVDDLVQSIKDNGLLHPIVITNEKYKMKLVAGERRLEAFRKLGLVDIPYLILSDLTTERQQTIELEENLKRQDLTWQERVNAINTIHNLYSKTALNWTLQQTADRIGVSVATIGDAVQIGDKIAEGDVKIATAATKTQAINIARRTNDRALSAILEEFSSGEEEKITTPESKSTPADLSILNADFKLWAESYKGPKFNFLHCDFPYGINFQKSELGNRNSHDTYNDTSEVYFSLIKTLVTHQRKLLADNCSLMFWFDMAQYRETYSALSELDFTIYPIPLIWHKSDNKGILSDPTRRMRHIYETAFYGHSGDMKSVGAVSDVYSCPVDKTEHLSLKPEPMLRNFFRMFVDGSTKMLDPTCGSGSSIRAAESLEANFVLGLELDLTVAKASQTELQLFRNKRLLAKLAGGK